MKMTKFIAAALILSAASGAFAAKKAKVTQSRMLVEQMDWQGATTGREIPSWVDAVVDGNTSAIAKELKISEEENKIFVVLGQGPNLDFVKAWTDNVDVVAEVSQTMSRVVKTDLQASMSSSDPASIQKALDMADRVCSLVEVNGLEKKTQYWIQTRKAKVSKPKKDADYETPVYNYYVVYTMNKDTYDESVKRAVEKGFANEQTSEAQAIKDIMMVSLAKTIAPEALGTVSQAK